MFWSILIYLLGIVKKWLDALKGEPFTSDTFDHFMRAFKSMLTSNISGESLRALSLYITYAVHKPKQKVPQSVRHARSVKQQTDGSSRRATILTASPSPLRNQDGEKELTRLQIAIKVMGMYTDLLCEREDVTNIKKFARIVTNKVKAIDAVLLKLLLTLKVAASSPCR